MVVSAGFRVGLGLGVYCLGGFKVSLYRRVGFWVGVGRAWVWFQVGVGSVVV